MNDTSCSANSIGDSLSAFSALTTSHPARSEPDEIAERLGRILKDLTDAFNNHDFDKVRALKIYVSRYFTADFRDSGIPIIRGWEEFIAVGEKMATTGAHISIKATDVVANVDHIESKAEFFVTAVHSERHSNIKYGAQNLFTWRRERGRWLLKYHANLRNLDMAM